MTDRSDSIGIVQPHDCFFSEGIRLHSGQILAPVSIRYETYGTLSEAKDNAILIEHALSGTGQFVLLTIGNWNMS